MKSVKKQLGDGGSEKDNSANNIIYLDIRFVAKRIGREGKFSWAVINRKTNKPYDSWATANLEERVAKKMARRLNLEFIHKLNS